MLRARAILGLTGTLAAFALALLLIDWQALLAAFARLSPGIVLVSSLFSIATTLILAIRWATLTAGPSDHPAVQNVHDALVGQVFNLITPAAVGADAYRVAVAGGRDGGRTRALAMLVLERMMGLATYALAFLLAFAVAAREQANQLIDGAAIIFAVTLAVLMGLIMTARHPIWARITLPAMWGESLHDAIGQVRLLPMRRLLAAAALTLVGLASWLLCLGVIAKAIGLVLPAQTIVMIAVVTECARLLPISIQGIGVREVTFASLAAQAGGAAAPAFAACATAYALHLVLGGFVGIAARTLVDYRHPRQMG